MPRGGFDGEGRLRHGSASGPAAGVIRDSFRPNIDLAVGVLEDEIAGFSPLKVDTVRPAPDRSLARAEPPGERRLRYAMLSQIRGKGFFVHPAFEPLQRS